MTKKDFTQIQIPIAATDAAGTAVKESIERSGSRSTPPAGKEERYYRAETMTTRGRKGCRSKRINMAFTDSNYDFIQIVSRATGMTMTRFVNQIIEEYRDSHADLYDKLLKVIDEIER